MPLNLQTFCEAECFGVGFPGSALHIECVQTCLQIGGFGDKVDPPMPIAFDYKPCCQGNGLNTGWKAVGASFPNPIVAMEYQ